MRFRTWLLVGITLLVLGIVVAIVGSLTRVLDRSVTRDLRDGLKHTQRAFEDLQDYHEDLYQSQAQVVAEEQRLKDVFTVYRDDADKRMSVAVDLQQILASVLFVLTDPQGRVTVDTSSSLMEGTDLSKDTSVMGALAKGSAHGVWISEGEAYQVHAQRLGVTDDILGVLIIGYPLDNEVAETIHRQTGSWHDLRLKPRRLKLKI
jgi:Tfp pilus assembly protein PilE